MNPYDQNYPNQYISDMYASAAFYPSQIYFLSDEAVNIWNVNTINENQLLFQPIQPFYQQQQESPNKNQLPRTRARDIQEQDSFSLKKNVEEQSSSSPQFKMRQKYGRNINSNIYHHMLKKITSQPKLVMFIQKVINKNGVSLNKEQFIQLLNKKINKLRTYVSLKKMSDMWKGSSSKQLNNEENLKKEKEFFKIFRIISRNYLINQHIGYVYNGLKIKKQSKKLHVNGSRKLYEAML